MIPLRLTIEVEHPGGPVTPLIGELTERAEELGCPVRGHVGIERLDSPQPRARHPHPAQLSPIDPTGGAA